MLPQLLLLRQTTVPTVIDSFYLLTLGSYRGFYILNWIVRAASKEHHFEPRAIIFGIIQTALYIDFAWVYWTRQRVKLRNGGVVDSDDLSRGYLVSRILGREGAEPDEEGAMPEQEPVNGHTRPVGRQGGRWGPRGISVSADEGILEPQPGQKYQSKSKDPQTVGDELDGLMDDDSEDEREQEQERSKRHDNEAVKKVGDGQEWRDNQGR